MLFNYSGLPKRASWIKVTIISVALLFLYRYWATLYRHLSHSPSSGEPSSQTEQSELALVVTSQRPLQSVASQPSSPSIPDKVVVMGKLSQDDTSWVRADLPDWQHAIYVVNDLNSTLTTPANKGKEAMPYLTYIIDNYHNLPSTMAFLHSHRDGYPDAWHTDDPNYSNPETLHRLNIDFVQRNGYANLRCIHIPGCPDEMQMFRNPPEDHRTTEHEMPAVWSYFFPDVPVPPVIGVACCAQFAVSRGQVHKHPLEFYERFRSWVLETELDDHESGRIMEYLWHIIFGQEPVYCPSLEQCRCDVYNQC